MSTRKKPRTGAGGTGGKSSRPAEPGGAESEAQVEEFEIPISTPVPADELRRLKKAAEQHSDRHDEKGTTQSDSK